MAEPVSEKNEISCFESIVDFCETALEDKKQLEGNVMEGNPLEMTCKELANIESEALTKLVNFIKRDREAMDLKLYYAERRLKELNLDQPYDFEDNKQLNEFGLLPGGGEVDF